MPTGAQRGRRGQEPASGAVTPVLKYADATTNHETLADAAYQRTKNDIIGCELPPGSSLTEAQLAARYQVGKAPIRAALSRLSQEGFVQALPRRGYIVHPVTLQDVNELFDIRALLEPAAAERAAGRIDEAVLRELDAVCKAGYLPGDRASEAAFLSANRSFHLAVAEASGNGKLTKMLSHVLDEMERLFHLGLSLRNRTHEMSHEHRSLIEALAKGDGRQAAALTLEQIEAARRMVLDAILSSPSIQQISIRA